MKTPTDKSQRRSKPRQPAKRKGPSPVLLSDTEVRSLVVRTTERIGADRFISIMMKAHDTLKSNRIRLVERALAECRLKSFQTLSRAAITMARSGERLSAMNLLFHAELYAYENTLDHARAFFPYCDQLQVSTRKRGRSAAAPM
jgi:hypothetical protein